MIINRSIQTEPADLSGHYLPTLTALAEGQTALSAGNPAEEQGERQSDLAYARSRFEAFSGHVLEEDVADSVHRFLFESLTHREWRNVLPEDCWVGGQFALERLHGHMGELDRLPESAGGSTTIHRSLRTLEGQDFLPEELGLEEEDDFI